MADRYWVGGTATWDGTAGSKWATSSGGAGGASAPTTSDNVFFDAASSGTVTLGASSVAANIDCTGFTGTWSHTASTTCTCAGTVFKLSAGMTYAPITSTRAWQFTATSGTCQITTAGKTLANITLNGVGGTFQLQDDLTATVNASLLTLTNGTFDANGFNVTVAGFASSNSNTRTLTMGSGLWTLTGTSTVWNTATTTGLTLNKGSADLVVSSTAASGRGFSGGGLTFNGLTIAANANSQTFSFVTSVRFSSVSVSGPSNISITSGVTLTIDTAPTWAGSAGDYVQVMSSTPGSTATISVPSGTMSLGYAAIRNITFTGGATFVAANSNDLKGNSGITITPPSGGGGSGGPVQLVNSEGLIAA